MPGNYENTLSETMPVNYTYFVQATFVGKALCAYKFIKAEFPSNNFLKSKD
jgi:hypothetical protein